MIYNERLSCPPCINSYLLACQAKDFHRFLEMNALSGKVCYPLIDINGNVHMSKSWLCPSVANVSEGIEAVFAKMRLSRPCKGCRLYKNFSQRHAQEETFLERMQYVPILRAS